MDLRFGEILKRKVSVIGVAQSKLEFSLRVVEIGVGLMNPHVELRDRLRDTIFDAQVTSRLQNFISVENRKNIAGVIEAEPVVNVLNLVAEIFLQMKPLITNVLETVHT